ncbi:MAG: hypothetical protein Q9188_002188 [Gyalolechia gomerana]
MWYQRGSIGSYQLWADKVGDPSYTFPELLPFFKKSAKFTGPDQVGRAGSSAPKFDPNVRSTSESSFLREALRRNGNLITYRNSLAKRILFDAAKRATGVEMESGGLGSGSVTYNKNATKEVILPSGAFRSPQLLMVSGIDPALILKENNIDILADRPGSQTRSDLDATFGPEWPDVEILLLDAYTGRLDDFLLGAPDLKNYTAICIAIVAPFSRGNVTINSSDTNDYPVVNPNWLGDARDREVAIAAFKRARAVS